MSEQPPKQSKEPYVFVSYARTDASKVQEEIAWLQSEGIRLWYDESADPGEFQPEDLADALEDAQKVLFYVTDAAMESDVCRREIAFASLRGLEILQVFLDEGGLTDEVRDDHHLGRVFQADASGGHRSELALALKEPVTRE
ncbi:MAG: toll/interleukin-1 receptor domain-containing protein [Pseudomonadales bacterium]|jgi:hypothetical protein|nr:toll/interleukin-1 receptor domain-containing protein [Pseudomonadales bacterium]MDP7358556.1 toll/interleukin-1 receptor domain-containing protein [Pseudomonadales bacterium]MDP7596017.1 toll/interleukin-1 receptor domain-containing protein [Pseudomonadales bacterium]HJN53067.1 toll/interleukin-1 receptor domain-containing protein [Pseudomonadales bacterium]|tara:strand:- start:235 stop:660 length:426 start_codon:yes stop_codon:yes gene_type:complete